jgi:DNA-binding XRE family transcriptional regulator
MLKTFLARHLKHGQLKAVARRAGIHANSVYAWNKGRNQPNVISCIWFFRAIAEYTGKNYELLWIEYIYTLEGNKDADKKVQEWVQSLRNKDKKADE